MRCFLLGIFYLTAVCATFAQRLITLSEYLPLRAGDTLTYINQIGEQVQPVVVSYSAAQFKQKEVVRIAETDGGWRYQCIDNQGFETFIWSLPNGKQWIAERPVRLLPAIAILQQVYTDTVLVYSLHNQVRGGHLKYSCAVSLEGFATAETPLRNFVDCLLLKQVIQTNDARHTRTEVQEWLAKGIGPVKIIEIISETDAKGHAQVVSRRILSLTAAFVDGQPLAGKKKRD